MTEQRRPIVRCLAATVSICAVVAGVAPGAAQAQQSSSAPVITSLSRHTGSRLGGQLVEIHGRNLSGVTSISFGPHAAPKIRRFSASHVEARTPASGSALYNVRVRSAGGVSAVGTQTHFRFGAPPQLFDIAPSSATTAGGSAAFVSGDDLKPTTAVTFGASAAKITYRGTNGVAVVVPAHAAGVVSMKVTTPYGTDSTTFRYGRANTTTWGKPTKVDPDTGDGTEAVSCAGGLCALLDVTGSVLTRSGSQAWSQPVKLGSYGVALSCATSSWCLATTDDAVFRYTGSTWTQVGPTGRTYTAVSCPVADYCIGASGKSLYRFDGSTWTGVFTFAHTVDDVSCSSVGHCVAVSKANVQARLTGETWTKLPAAPRDPHSADLSDPDSGYSATIVCPTDTRCLLTGPSEGAVAQLDGSTWKLTPHVLDGLAGLACASATRCIAVSNDEDTNQQPLTSTATFDGTSWSAAKRFPYGDLVAADDGTVAVAASSPTTWLASAGGYVSEST